MLEESQRPVGLTKDVGYQIGVRRTIPIRHQDAWRLLMCDQGVKLWLGVTSEFDLTEGAGYQLIDG
ncbi:MAG: SRPBCC domain-containing protein, partial [Anaerolineae bacterium]|nr:SRPBCC domain-containing protein [Anaerolineae bacterium]